MRIGIFGATGPAGRGLASRFAEAGHDVFVGSRDAAKAERIVGELRNRWGDRVGALKGVGNHEAAEAGELAMIAVPAGAAATTAADLAGALAGKIVVSMANGLVRRGSEFAAVMPPEGSVTAAVARAVPGSRVVGAFHHVPADALGDLDRAVDCDVLVCSDDREAAATVVALAEEIAGLRAFDVGGLVNAVGIEAFSATILSFNVRHRRLASVRLTGVER